MTFFVNTVPRHIIYYITMFCLTCQNLKQVEIMLHGHPVIPSLRLRNLVDVWCQTAPSGTQEIQTSVGNSAKDFVLLLSYARKVASP